jgi:hypothetical protein
MEKEILHQERLRKAKSAYSVRRVNLSDAVMLKIDTSVPKPGDVVLARVKKIGQHKRLELAGGRRAHLFNNDEIVVCYGNRYATNQFEAEVPDSLKSCHLVAAGGIASRMLSKHDGMKNPTSIMPLGLLADKEGATLNLSRYALQKRLAGGQSPSIIAVAGSSMDAGKTTTVASLIRGISAAGLRVGAAKVTGTGAGGDSWVMKDAGAHHVLDFTDAGFSSTYRLPLESMIHIMELLINELKHAGTDVIVLELADGLFQEETSSLLLSSAFKHHTDGMVLASSDAMGASTGIDWLKKNELPLFAVSGVVTRSPLAIREVIENTGVPVLTPEVLSSADVVDVLQTVSSQRVCCTAELTEIAQ